MKNIFKEAHKMTREIASKYEVDYRTQFGLCLSYLLNKEDVKMEGTKKQIKFANDIKKKMEECLNEIETTLHTMELKRPEKQIPKNEKAIAEVRKMLNNYEDARELINDHKEGFFDVIDGGVNYISKLAKFSIKVIIKTNERIAK